MIPHNADIEKAVLGSLLMGKADYCIQLTEDDFHSDANALIYNTIREMHDKNKVVDEMIVADQISGRLDKALEYVIGLQDFVTSPENVQHYIDLLQAYTFRRKTIMAAQTAKELAESENYDNPVELKADIMQLFDYDIKDRRKQDHSMGAIIGKVLDDIEYKYNSKDEEKLFTGFYDLDKLTAGLHGEELTIVAARPGVGKTAFAIQLMLNMAKKGCKCLFVSREMSEMQIAKRILSNMSNVDGQKIRFAKSLQDDDWGRIAQTVSEMESLPVELNDKLESIQEIRAYCRELKNKDRLNLLIVDYLQLCRSLKKTENRRQEIDDISRQLKEISLEFGIPVIALSQLSRESVKSTEPELNHLRESGSIEQDADNVIFLHVPANTDETQNSFDIKVILAKQRNGPTGFIFLRYFRRTFKLCNISLR